MPRLWRNGVDFKERWMKNQDPSSMQVPRPVTLPERIEVIRDRDGARLIVDGEPFVLAIACGSVSVHVNDAEIPGVTITLMALNVSVSDSLNG